MTALRLHLLTLWFVVPKTLHCFNIVGCQVSFGNIATHTGGKR